MNTITIPRNTYEKIIETQKKLLFQVDILQKCIIEANKEELGLPVIRRLEKISRNMDSGNGKRFRSASSVATYFNTL